MKAIASALTGLILLAGFGDPASAEEKILNVYNWSDYIGPDTIADFEKEYGIKVHYDTFDSNETLEAKMLTGKSGYDIVVPTASFFARQIKAGVYLKLDKSKLPNLKNLNPVLYKDLADYDPGNAYAIPYMFGTSGFSYNVDMVKKLMPDAPLDSLATLFDPAVISKFKNCGVSFLDSPEDVFQLALAYLHKDPNSEKPADLDAAVKLLLKVRPYIRKFDSQGYINDLTSGDLCIAMSWSGDYATAQARAAEANVKVKLAYTIPKEGSNLWFDGMLIPRDAPHPGNALTFLNYIMEPKVIAACTNFTNYANANQAADPYVEPKILNDPAIYPDPETLKRMFGTTVKSAKFMRLMTRAWTKVKTGT
jgi:putrescine transport system substrate-binding protein